jgi:hypothetical protein
MRFEALASFVTGSVVLLSGCTDDSIRYEPNEWTGSTERLAIGSIHGDTSCPRMTIENALRASGLPTALVETVEGKVTLYVGGNPFPWPPDSAVGLTGRSLDAWKLYTWTPPDGDDEYHYILLPNDGRDAILYQRMNPELCDLSRLEAEAD